MIRAYQSNKGDIIVRGVEFVLISLNITAICLEIVLGKITLLPVIS